MGTKTLSLTTNKFNDVRVLVVDDHSSNREISRAILEFLGCKIDTASNGYDAINLYQTNDYDLIFMDIKMPEISGYETSQLIRDLEKKSLLNRRTPIIATTASTTQKDKEKCLIYDMDGYISKPLNINNIEKILEDFVKIKQSC